MPEPTNPNVLKDQPQNHDEALSQLAGEEIDRLLSETDKKPDANPVLEKPQTQEKLAVRLENLFNELNGELVAEADTVKQETSAGKERVNIEPQKTDQDVTQEEASRNQALTETSAVVSEFGGAVAAINSTESAPETSSFEVSDNSQNIDQTKKPEESSTAATSVGLEAQAVESDLVIEKETSATQPLSPVSEKPSGVVVEESVGRTKEEQEIVDRMKDKLTTFKESRAGATATRIEPLPVSVELENNVVNDIPEETREAPVELTQAVEGLKNRPPEVKPENKAKSESGYLDSIGKSIGKFVKKAASGEYAVNVVPISAVENQEERKTRVANERYIKSMEPKRESVLRNFLPKKIVDIFEANETQKRKTEASVNLAFITKTLENDSKHALEIESELKTLEEKIAQIPSDTNLDDKGRATMLARFEEQKKRLTAEQPKLKKSVETATADHEWVKGQLKSFETFQEKVVGSITMRNEERLAPLYEQRELYTTEISNFKDQIKNYGEYIKNLDAQKKEIVGELDSRALDDYKNKVGRANGEIEKIKKQLSRRFESAMRVGEKIQKLEAESNKFSNTIDRKLSDKEKHADIEVEKTAPVAEAPKPAPSSSSSETYSSPDSGYDADDDEPEPETPAPKKSATPTSTTTPKPAPVQEAPVVAVKAPAVEVAPVVPATPKTLEAIPVKKAEDETDSVFREATPTILTKKEKPLRKERIKKAEGLRGDVGIVVGRLKNLKEKAGKIGFLFIKKNLGSDMLADYDRLNKVPSTPKEARELIGLSRRINFKMKEFKEKRKKRDAIQRQQQNNAVDRQPDATEKFKKPELSDKEKRAAKLKINEAHNKNNS